MTARILALAPTALLLLLTRPQEKPGYAEMKGVRGIIRVKNYTHLKTNAEGETELIGLGNPVEIEDTGTGVTLIAKSMVCTLVQSAAGEYTVKQATLSEGAQVLIDSAVADKAAADKAKQLNQPAPPPATEQTRTHLESDTIAYTLENGESVLTLPKPLNYTATTDGTLTKTQDTAKVQVPFTQLVKISGSRGRFTFQLPAKPKEEIQPRLGSIDGPVKFLLVRTETPAPVASATAVAETTNISGVGDHFDADFVQPGDPTMTLTGNVSVDGAGRGLNGNVKGSKAVITLDKATRKPKGYDFSGDPAVTTVKSNKAGGR